MGTLIRPVSLFVERVSYEKNIEAFLKLDIPGTEVVCGVGPLRSLPGAGQNRRLSHGRRQGFFVGPG